MAGKKKTNNNEVQYKVGDRVEALFKGKYYDARVSKIHANGTYDVNFEGTTEKANDVEKVQRREGAEKKKPTTKSTPPKKTNSAKSSPKGMSLSKQFLQVESESASKKTRGGKIIAVTSPSRAAPAKTRQSPAKATPQKSKQPVAKISGAKVSVSRAGSAKPTPQKESQRVASNKSDRIFKVGDTVEALWDADGFYYDAKVEKVINGKFGVTYDLRFVQDNILEKGRKATQIQGIRNADESTSESEEEGSQSSTGSRKKSKDVDTDYSGGVADFADDYVVNEDSDRSEEGEEYRGRASRHSSNKRKRVVTQPQRPNKIPKKRRDEMIDNLTKLRKDQIVDLVYEIIEKKSVIAIGDLEKGIAERQNSKK